MSNLAKPNAEVVRMLRVFTLTFLLSVLCVLIGKAQTPIVFESSDEVIRIGAGIGLFHDTSAQMTLEQVLATGVFVASEKAVPHLKVIPEPVWVRIPIQNNSAESELLLELEQATMDEVEFYHPTTDGSWAVEKTGEIYPFDQREFPDANYVFHISLPPGQTEVYYLKIRSTENIHLPLWLGTVDAVAGYIKTKDFFWGVFTGIMLVMFLYNLFVYFSVRDRSYLWYVIYIGLVLATQVSLHGYLFQFVWPNSSWLAIHGIFIIPALVGMAAVEFMKVFLRTKETMAQMHRFFIVGHVVYVVVIALALLGYYEYSFVLLEINAGTVSMYMLVTAIIIARKGYRPARFFVLAWTIFLVGVITYVVMDNGFIAHSNFGRYLMPIGSAVETVLLSFGLADRINILKREKEESLLENERIVREQNVILERKVQERTEALQESNQELAVTLDNLKETQAQLVQAEKMSSLGQLTAGIAHEINNSINFVTANTRPLKRDLQDVFTLLAKYDELGAQGFSAEHQLQIANLKKELELDVLIEEIDTSINSISEGAQRTVEIAAGLKTFSRVDEGGLMRASINAGINSTVMLLEASLGEGIIIDRQLGEMPETYCYANKLNQVFMNLLNNSVAAINSRQPNPGKGTITIRTWLENDFVNISFKDDGIGMAPATKDKAFDPFFTTKDVGEGTGLGLSITHGIINNHKGTITVNSTLGAGAEFLIRFPFLAIN